jgi:hypothetical protein
MMGFWTYIMVVYMVDLCVGLYELVKYDEYNI